MNGKKSIKFIVYVERVCIAVVGQLSLIGRQINFDYFK